MSKTAIFYILSILVAITLVWASWKNQEDRAQQCIDAGYAPLYRGYVVLYCQRSVNNQMELVKPEDMP